jgi:hypothetical protein
MMAAKLCNAFLSLWQHKAGLFCSHVMHYIHVYDTRQNVNDSFGLSYEFY